jgi:HAD superfamily phosphatase (TIGR01681 family)
MISNENDKKILFFIDLDDTLITKDNPQLLLEKNGIKFLNKLKKSGVMLFISSRNFPYVVINVLKKHSIVNLFQIILADFRNKKFHIKEALSDLKKQSILPKAIIFLDDHLLNCENVAELKDEIKAKIYPIQYAKSPKHNLEQITNYITKNEWTKLKELCII